jgi:very-short-patch-repair endonuclease
VTEAERRDLAHTALASNARYKFRQVRIGHYIADFACHEARLIVEIEGGQHDRSSPSEVERSGFLQDDGYRILRFWNNEVLANLNGLFETIAEELSRITPTQTLPIKGYGIHTY